MAQQTYHGGCHCKAVRYSAQIDLDEQVIECNCSHCGAKGILWQFIPVDRFTLEQGQESLTEYLFNSNTIKHQFCKVCGVEPFAFGQTRGEPTIALNIRSIDNVDVAALTKKQVNGKVF